VNSAQSLGVSAIFPLTTLNYMLLCWQRAELEEANLSNSDPDEEDEECDENGEPLVRYTTEKEYQA
jgi:hypothetical protein